MADDNSAYSVVITNSLGTATSNASTLTVQAATPSITTDPTAQSVIAGQTATFTVSASGRPTLTYQWRKNGANITGATASSYSTPVTIGDNTSQYSVVVTNTAGSATSAAAPLTVQASTINHLVISEVSSCYYYDVDCWFEIHNPTGSAIDLSTYQIGASSIDVVFGGALSPLAYSLPSLSVPADGYVIISGNARSAVQRGSQMVRLRSGDHVPFWTGSGFIELLNTGTTVDFVRFGSSAQTPTTGGSGQWSGGSAPTLPNTATDYGKSIVRIYPRSADTDSNTPSDWTSVSWSTPAGRNDVPSTATDSDADGIPDSAEIAGGSFAGLDLYAMGARTGQRNIFIEVDRMNSADPGVIPRSEALQKLVDAFSAKNIAVHIDAGTAFSASFSRTAFNLGQGSNVVDYEPCATFNQTTCNLNSSNRRSIYDWKDDSMDLRRRAVFHYLLFANSQNADGSSGSSGLAELPGNDLIVSMGNWGLTTSPMTNLNRLINMQASTIMHELGHNLNLQHGGNVSTNYKPNYWSVMNYLYQLNGLDANPAGSTAYQRWRKEIGDGTPTTCALPNSPCGDPALFIMSYSDGSSSSLNEASLLESANIGRGSTAGAYADWDMNGILTSGALMGDLNADGSQTVLTDFNDWGNLLLPFARRYSANSGLSASSTSSSSSAAVPNPITADKQPIAHELPPPPRFFEELRRAR